MNDKEIVILYNKRKQYQRDYARKRYHNDPEYRKNQIERQKLNPKNNQYYKKNSEKVKSKIKYNKWYNAGRVEDWKLKYPDDYQILVKDKYILEDLNRNPETFKTKVIDKNVDPHDINNLK